ncbi:MAG: RtcB family protein [Mycobacterium sp.]|jgi:tRNA-splicing ligase RtcB (3'-phosphate/5'-hydroxy nucleic acid ligase)|uniref:RtcB family protein n=1 Tax=Mycobacterium sp. TaxID=1785 RepID=UPI003899CC4D
MQQIEGQKVVNFASQIDAETIEQAKRTAALPFVYPHLALMPDAHLGKGAAVGTVIPTLGAVIPAAVGVDIGCGMIAARTRFTAADIAGKNTARLRNSLESAIPLSAGSYNRSLRRFAFTQPRLKHLENLAADHDVDLSHSPKWKEQLGTLGGGNHFIELCIDDDDKVWMFLHSGSRGVGYKIATRHINVAKQLCRDRHSKLPDPDLAYLPEGTPEFDTYIAELRWAQQFALANREEMMDRFRQTFAHWMQVDAGDVELERVNSHHNYSTPERHAGKDVWLTRKGAVDAHRGVMSVIPGSMGTRSYIVRGKGNPTSLCSAPHGAGRRFSRSEAKRRFTAADLAARMEGIEYRHGEAWVDEIPDAYKSIDTVMKDSKDLVEVVTSLRQIVNVKGT